MRKYLLSFFAALTCTFCLPFAGLSQNPGDIDLDFGVDGYASVPFKSEGRTVHLAIGPNDEIWAVIQETRNSNNYIHVTKFDANGELEEDFGYRGQLRLAPNLQGYRPGTVSARADGGMYISGVYGSSYFLLKMLRDGSLDPAFGTDGVALYQPNSNSFTAPFGILERANGKVVVGADYNGDYMLLQFDSDGTLDPAFGQSGVAIFSDEWDVFGGRAMALQRDGSIVVVGNFTVWGGDIRGGFAQRYHVDGSPDTNFGTYIYGISGYQDEIEFNRVQVLEQGEILVVGTHFHREASGGPLEHRVIFHRITADGATDVSYGNDGTATLSPAPLYGKRLLSYQYVGPCGNGYALGREFMFAVVDGFPLDHFLGKFSPSGAADPAFGNQAYGTEGLALIEAPTAPVDSVYLLNIAQQSSGKLILAGGSPSELVLTRLENTAPSPAPASSDQLLGFPNPISPGGLLQIPSFCPPPTGFFALYNSQGQMVQEWAARRGAAGNLELQLRSELSAGVYFLHYQGPDQRTGMRILVE